MIAFSITKSAVNENYCPLSSFPHLSVVAFLLCPLPFLLPPFLSFSSLFPQSRVKELEESLTSAEEEKSKSMKAVESSLSEAKKKEERLRQKLRRLSVSDRLQFESDDGTGDGQNGNRQGSVRLRLSSSLLALNVEGIERFVGRTPSKSVRKRGGRRKGRGTETRSMEEETQDRDKTRTEDDEEMLRSQRDASLYSASSSKRGSVRGREVDGEVGATEGNKADEGDGIVLAFSILEREKDLLLENNKLLRTRLEDAVKESSSARATVRRMTSEMELVRAATLLPLCLWLP